MCLHYFLDHPPYICSENKDADQLRVHCAADLCLCFCICNKQIFSRRGSMLKLCSLSPLDRHSHDSVEVQKEEEKKFKEVGEAYAVLSDQKKRSRYDNGHDLEDLDGGGFGRYLGQ